MKPLYERLKNFVGIRNGLGLDEVSADLSSLVGLVALIGSNGRGKTTFLDNMHPHRLMPSKVGNGNYSPGACDLYNEVYGVAEKEFHFYQDGKTYKTLLRIDADNRKTEGYIDVLEDDGNWKALNKSGRASTYDTLIEAIVGSPKLFFNSIFRCQEAPRLNTYRKGAIKDIFSELLMLENIKDKGKAAKAVVSTLDQLVDRLKAQEMMLVPDADRLLGLTGQLAADELNLQSADEELKAAEKKEQSLSAAKNSQEVELGQLRTQESGRDKAAGQVATIEQQLVSLCRKREDLETRYAEKIKAYGEKRVRIEKILGGAGGIRSKVLEETASSEKLVGLETELKDVALRIDQAATFAREAAQVTAELNPLRIKQGQNKTAHQAKITAAKNEIARIEKQSKTLDGLTCSEDSQKICPAVKNTLEDKQRLGTLKQDLTNLEAQTGEDKAVAEKIDSLQVKVADLNTKGDAKKDTDRRVALTAEIAGVKKVLVDISKWTKLLPELETAEQTMMDLVKDRSAALDELDSDMAANIAEDDQVEQELVSAQKVLSEYDIVVLSIQDAEQRKGLLSAQLEEARKEVSAAREARTSAAVSVASLQEGIKNASAAKEKLDAVRGKIAEINDERPFWSTLEKAYGNDGIIALEIDDSGPSVSALANELLSSCFGSQFSVRIDTQEFKTDGNTAETFNIRVIDNETGTTSSLADKSGGQKTWLEDAVTRAIALLNAERSGKRYHTLFTDERDGALSQDVKREFFLMKRRALELGGFGAEFFISHTPEAQDLSDRKLVFEKGVGVVVK